MPDGRAVSIGAHQEQVHGVAHTPLSNANGFTEQSSGHFGSASAPPIAISESKATATLDSGEPFNSTECPKSPTERSSPHIGSGFTSVAAISDSTAGDTQKTSDVSRPAEPDIISTYIPAESEELSKSGSPQLVRLSEVKEDNPTALTVIELAEIPTLAHE